MLTLAIIGRPNVGKSTLFNRLVGKRLALVDDRPGVTRDLREGDARLADLRFVVIDTAGLEEATDDRLNADILREARNTGSQAANAAHDEIDFHAGAARVVKSIDDLSIDKGNEP